MLRISDLRNGYKASVSHVDYEIGRVLDHLETTDLHQDTIIVLTSDHGYLLGENDAWQERSLFMLATQVPLVIAGPSASFLEGKGII